MNAMSELKKKRWDDAPDAKPRGNAGRAALAVLLAVLVPAAACSRKKQAAPPPGAPVHVAQTLARDMPLEIGTVGNVEAYSSVQVKALVSGQVVNAFFQEGQDVKSGDRLFLIDPRPFEIALRQAEATLARDQAQLKNAEDDLSRYVDLAAKDYVTQENFEQLKANASVLRATVKGDASLVDNARLQLEYCSIRSPIDGRTGSVLIHPGNIIKANDTISAVVILQVTPIYVTYSVPQQYLSQIKKFMAQGKLKTEVFPEGDAGPSVAGELTFVDNSVDTTTGTILLKSTFANKDKALWPGRYLNVVLTLTLERGRIVVPAQAVQSGQNGPFVMVVKSDMTVESRPVSVERTQDNLAVVASGLQAGETVVTDGLLRLTPGAKVDIQKPAEKTP